jgi:hypothetical protein
VEEGSIIIKNDNRKHLGSLAKLSIATSHKNMRRPGDQPAAGRVKKRAKKAREGEKAKRLSPIPDSHMD